MPPLNPPADDEPGAPTPAAENPATPGEDAAGADLPQWIEVGTPQRRPFPPAWADEAPTDAWSAPQVRQSAPETSAAQAEGTSQGAGAAQTGPAASTPADPWLQGPDNGFIEIGAGLRGSAQPGSRGRRDPGVQPEAVGGSAAEDVVGDAADAQDNAVGEQPTEQIPVAEARKGSEGRPVDPTEPLILPEVRSEQHGTSEDVNEPLPLMDAESAESAEGAEGEAGDKSAVADAADEGDAELDGDDGSENDDGVEIDVHSDTVDEVGADIDDQMSADIDVDAGVHAEDPTGGEQWEGPEDETRWQVVTEDHDLEPEVADEPIAPDDPAPSELFEDSPEEPVDADGEHAGTFRDVHDEPLHGEHAEAGSDIGTEVATAGVAAARPVGGVAAGAGAVTAAGTAKAGAAPAEPVPVPARDTAREKKRARSTEASSPRGTVQGAFDVLGPHVGEQRTAVITGSVLAVLSVWLLVALPFPLKAAVNAVTGTDAGASLSVPVLVLIGVLLAHVATAYGAVAAFGRAGTRVASSLRGQLIRHIHHLAPDAAGQSLDTAPSEKTSGPLTEDAGRLRDLLAFAGPRLAAGLLAIACSLVVLLLVTPLAALVVAVTGLVLALIARMLTRRARAAHRHAVAEEVLLADSAHELVSATRTIQYYGLEEHAQHTLAEVGSRAGRARAAARRADAALRTAGSVITGLGIAALVMVAGSSLRAGSITPGDLALALFYLLLTSIVLQQLLSRHSGSLSAAAEAGDRIRELLERPTGIAGPERAQPMPSVRGEIVFSAVTAPGRNRHLFETVSFVVPAGQHVALMDQDGSESSALISYLLRFDQPETGRVLLDRFDTRAVSLPDLRRQIAVVQREPALFTDTARENIRVGRPDASEEEVVAAARAAGVDEVITALPDGYDTVLARRGAALTDGSRRRIAIARALLRDAPIVVLDGADEDLAGTERDAVLTSLAALTAGRTAIVASREPATVTGMDRVVWFRDGAISEDAAPSALTEDPDSQYATWLRALEEDLR